MHHHAHVGPVDPHAEGVGRHHHRQRPLGEGRRDPGPELGREPRVVGGRVPPALAELLCEPLRSAAGGRVHDPRAGRIQRIAERLRQRGRGLFAGLAGAVHRARREVEVGPGEAAQHEVGLALGPAEAAGDLGARLRRGGGGAGEDAGRLQAFEGLADAEVLGPEVVPPLHDAVRLVHGDERDPGGRESLQEALALEALRRGVHHPHGALAQLPEPAARSPRG